MRNRIVDLPMECREWGTLPGILCFLGAPQDPGMIHKALWPDPGAQAGMSPPSPDNLWCQLQLGTLGKGSYRSLQSPDRAPEVPLLPKPSQDGMGQLQTHKTATKCSKENSLTPAKNLREKRRETQNSAAPWNWGAPKPLRCSSMRGESTEGTHASGILLHRNLKGAGNRVESDCTEQLELLPLPAPSPSPATSFSQLQGSALLLPGMLQDGCWKQGSYGFEQPSTQGSKRGEHGWFSPESSER